MSGWQNLDVVTYPGTGALDMPGGRRCTGLQVTEFVDLTRAAQVPPDRRRSTGVHFFLPDNLQERAWRDPLGTRKLLSGFGAVIGPTFSVYTDFPLPVRLFNLYRNAWLCRFFQDGGINVVPVAVFAGDMLPACLSVLPENSVLAFSAVGSMNSPEKEAEFLRGAGHIIREKEPLRLVVYGKARGLPEIPTLHIPSFTELLHQRLGRTGA